MNNNIFQRQAFAPKCPAGGTWWACGRGTFFVGCCARDPCDITCAQGNLYPGGFDPSAYGSFPDATCGTGSKFYTCKAGQTFWGCCKTNACSQGGCPDGDLEPAIMNRNDQLVAYQATGGSTSSTATQTATPTASSFTTTASVTASTTASASPSALAQTERKTPVAAIAGGAAGGALVLVLVIGLLIYYCCHAKKSRKRHTDAVTGPTSLPALTTGNDSDKPMDTVQVQQYDAPPNYTSPNPNNYSPHNQPYYTFAHTHQQPTELPSTYPTTPHSPSLKSTYNYNNAPGPSELPGQSRLSELETPEIEQQGFATMPNILRPGSDGGSPRRISRRAVSSSDVGAGEGVNYRQSGRMDWSAPQDWHMSEERERERGGQGAHVDERGLGMQGVDDIMARMERLERLDDQRADGSRGPESHGGGYRGV